MAAARAPVRPGGPRHPRAPGLGGLRAGGPRAGGRGGWRRGGGRGGGARGGACGGRGGRAHRGPAPALPAAPRGRGLPRAVRAHLGAGGGPHLWQPVRGGHGTGAAGGLAGLRAGGRAPLWRGRLAAAPGPAGHAGAGAQCLRRGADAGRPDGALPALHGAGGPRRRVLRYALPRRASRAVPEPRRAAVGGAGLQPAVSV
jgi:hypothetical protein